MAPSRADIDAIIQASSNVSSATTATIAALQRLLDILPPSTQSRTSSKSASQSRTIPQTSKAAPRSRTKSTLSKNTDNVSVLTEDIPNLSAKDRLILATQVFNATIRAISSAAKQSTTKPHLTSPSSKSPTQQRSRALATRSPNSPSKVSRAHKSPSDASRSPISSLQGIAVVAECARLTFGYVRAHDKQVSAGGLNLQLETATLGYIGNCLTLGLDRIAAKELRAQKKRLQASSGFESQKDCRTDGIGKESLGDLLDLATTESETSESTFLLLMKYHNCAARMILKRLSHSEIDHLLALVHLKNVQSPLHTTLEYARKLKDQTQVVRQMESYLSTLSAACPSVGSDADLIACDPKRTISPSQSLRIHAAVWQCRLVIADLQRRNLDVEKDFWRPLSRCFAAYTRRTKLMDQTPTCLGQELFKQLLCAVQISDLGIDKSQGHLFISQIMLNLSLLAQSASRTDEAIHWVEEYQRMLPKEESNTVKAAISAVRLATLTLQAGKIDNLAIIMSRAHSTLVTSLRGDSNDLDLLLLEVVGYRRTLMTSMLAAIEAGTAVSEADYRNGVYSCLRFLLRYVSKPVGNAADQYVLSRQAERLHKAAKAAPGFTDSVFHCCKVAIKDSSTVWRDIDSALEDAIQLVTLVDEDQEPSRYCQTIVVIKAASLYWAYYRHEATKSGDLSSTGIRALKRSVAVLKSETSDTRERGQYILKLERLAQVYRGLQHYDSSLECLQELMQQHFDSGVMSNLIRIASQTSYDGLWASENGVLIGNTLYELVLLIHHADRHGRTSFSFYENISLSSEASALLLERQLVSYSNDTIKPGFLQHSSQLERVSTALSALLNMYDRKSYPIRRQRTILLCAKLAHLMTSSVSELYNIVLSQSQPSEKEILQSQDRELLSFNEHLSLSIGITKSIRNHSIGSSQVEHAIDVWRQMFLDTTNPIEERIDCVPLFVNVLSLLSEFCEIQLHAKLQISVLSLMESVMLSRKSQDHSAMADILIQISLIQLRMGYSGAAALTQARAKVIIENTGTLMEINLRYHLAHAEYYLALGDVANCEDSLRSAQSIGLDDLAVLTLRSSSLVGSSKIRKLLCHGLEISSSLKLKSGFPAAALRDAKQCLKLLQRTWGALENEKGASSFDLGNSSIENCELGASVSNSQVIGPRSLTHTALKGARMWHLVPSLIRIYQHISSIYTHFGMFQESLFWIDSAEKIISVLNSPVAQLQNASLLAEHHITAGDVKTGQAHLDRAVKDLSTVPVSIELVRHHRSVARMWKARNQIDAELESIDAALQVVKHLTIEDPVHVSSKSRTSEDQLVSQLAQLQIDSKKPSIKTARAMKGRAVVPATIPKKKQNVTSNPVNGCTTISKSGWAPDYAPLAALQTQLLMAQIVALTTREEINQASKIVGHMSDLTTNIHFNARKAFVEVRFALFETLKAFSVDCTFGMLADSTISIPSLAASEFRDAVSTESKQRTTKVPAARSTKIGAARKTTRSKVEDATVSSRIDLGAKLCSIRDKLMNVQPLASRALSVAEYGEMCSLLASISAFVSATNQQKPQAEVHPNSAALLIDEPNMYANRLVKAASAAGGSIAKEDIYVWPSVASLHDTTFDHASSVSPSQFQKLYIDIIPEPWTAISLHLSDSKEDLFVARYRKGQSPFVLRMPITPHNNDLESSFTYEDGKSELLGIIAESYDTTHNAAFIDTKEAKKDWWAIREALDARIHEMLQNIEKIWFGGFRGIFSSQVRQPALLMKLQKAVLASLNRHLPSRQGKKVRTTLALDSRIWEMFIGLGDPRDDSVDVDESLVDLLYFIVDVLQFNGEINAYDEVDFDSIVVETIDALKAYHSASVISSEADKEHTILILDQNLHIFPWESMPCLASKNVSRLPSLEDLRTRINSMKQSAHPKACETSTTSAVGHHVSKLSGSSLLNPSGDLRNTETVLQPLLATLPDTWSHSTNAPNDKELIATLSTNSLFLYFGHGSGNQFVSGQQVRNLQSCPTTWLMGCSSARLKCHGDTYLPSGMVLSYLAAGAPAVVGTLWDVTDKDCDRASVHMGETWGLWRTEGQHKLLAFKGRQRAAETEQARDARDNGKGKKGTLKIEGHGGAKASDADAKVSLVESVRLSRDQCYLRYLNGAALVVYGIPVYLDD